MYYAGYNKIYSGIAEYTPTCLFVKLWYGSYENCINRTDNQELCRTCFGGTKVGEGKLEQRKKISYEECINRAKGVGVSSDDVRYQICLCEKAHLNPSKKCTSPYNPTSDEYKGKAGSILPTAVKYWDLRLPDLGVGETINYVVTSTAEDFWDGIADMFGLNREGTEWQDTKKRLASVTTVVIYITIGYFVIKFIKRKKTSSRYPLPARK